MNHSNSLIDADNFAHFDYPSDDDDHANAATGALMHTALPKNTFSTFAALRASLQGQAATLGFAIVTKRSDAAKGVGTLGCTIGGVHRTAMGVDYDAVRNRDIRTIRDGCPFLIKAYRLRGTESGEEEGGRGAVRAREDEEAEEAPRQSVWTFRTVDNTHNHAPNDVQSLAALRLLTITPEIRQFIEHEIEQSRPTSTAFTKPRETLPIRQATCR